VRPLFLACSTIIFTFAACSGGAHEHDHTPSAPLPDAFPGTLDVTGRALYVALGKAGGIAVVDVDGWRLAGTINLSSRFFPHHLGWDPQTASVQFSPLPIFARRPR
jgi:hypothetical protein